MFIVQLPHGLSRTGYSYLAAATEKETKGEVNGNEFTIPPHGNIAVLQVEEATMFESEEEAQAVADGLFVSNTEEELALNEAKVNVVTYNDALIRQEQMLGHKGPFHNPRRHMDDAMAMASPNQVSVLIDIEDTVLSMARLPKIIREATIEGICESIKDHIAYEELITNMRRTLRMTIPENVSLDEYRKRLMEDLAMVYKYLMKYLVPGMLTPFDAEDLVIIKDGTPSLNIITASKETLVSLAEYYTAAEENPIPVDLTKVNIQSSVLNFITHMDGVLKDYGIEIYAPIETTLVSTDTRTMNILLYILGTMGVSKDAFKVAPSLGNAYALADVFISAKSITYTNGRITPSSLSAFHRWNALGSHEE